MSNTNNKIKYYNLLVLILQLLLRIASKVLRPQKAQSVLMTMKKWMKKFLKKTINATPVKKQATPMNKKKDGGSRPQLILHNDMKQLLMVVTTRIN